MRVLIVTLLLVGLAAPALAQPLINPGAVTFTVSTDHALVTYRIGYFLPGATNPVQTSDLGTGTPNAQGDVTFPINVHPITFGLAYIAKVKAVAGAIESEWSDPSNPFDRAPERTGQPVVKK